jgi:WASH complex subunit strumpellin
MLYVVLHFAPDVLHRQRTTMREIVDKHFNDNWITTVYMGWTVNLREAWSPYAAARDALKNTLQPENVQDFSARHARTFRECQKQLRRFLTEGVLDEDLVLDKLPRLMACVRACNVTVRWMMLHYREADRQLRQIVVDPEIPSALVMQVLLHVAQLEFRLRTLLSSVLSNKEERWETSRRQCAEMMRELSEYFSGTRALTRVERNADLQEWFGVLARQIEDESLAFREHGRSRTGRKIQKLLEALHDVEQFEQIDTSLQIKEFLSLARRGLTAMVRAANVRETHMAQLDQVADFSYAWEMISDYVPYLHELVEVNPNAVVLLRATFQKLASILDVPLIRINQAGSKDVASVAHYYSNELVEFVRRVLEVVPKKVFSTLRELIEMHATQMKPLPVRLELTRAGELAQMPQRYKLAKATHEISVFTEGILKMEQTLLGVIEVDPRRVLEDGIRKELVLRVGGALHAALQFKRHRRTGHYSVAQVEGALDDAGKRLAGFRRSFEYIQDYVNLYGLKIWQEECSRVLGYNTEQECNRYVRKKVRDEQSRFQSSRIPVRKFKPTDPEKKYPNFMGRLTAALLGLTDPRLTVYAPESLGWYQQASGEESAGLSLFSRLNASIGVFGMAGVDTVLAFRVVRGLQRLVGRFRRGCVQGASAEGSDGQREAETTDAGIPRNAQGRRRAPPARDAAALKTAAQAAALLRTAGERLAPVRSLPVGAETVYAQLSKRLSAQLDGALPRVLRVGQAQLLRRALRNELGFSAKLDSNLFYSSLETLNGALLDDVAAHYRDSDKPYPEGNPVLAEAGAFAEAAGLYEPLAKIYVTSEPLEGLPLFLFALVTRSLDSLEHDANFGSLVRRRSKHPLDGAPLAVGVATVLKQFHPSYTERFLGLMGQSVKVAVHASLTGRRAAKASSLPEAARKALVFVDMFCRFAKVRRSALEGYIPRYIMDTMVDFGPEA